MSKIFPANTPKIHLFLHPYINNLMYRQGLGERKFVMILKLNLIFFFILQKRGYVRENDRMIEICVNDHDREVVNMCNYIAVYAISLLGILMIFIE